MWSPRVWKHDDSTCLLCTYQCQARGGGGSGIGWGFWHFLKKIVKIPTPGEKELSKLGEKNGFLLFYSLKLKDKMHNVRSKSPPWGYTPESKSRGLPDPPPLGLDIDRCITCKLPRHRLKSVRYLNCRLVHWLARESDATVWRIFRSIFLTGLWTRGVGTTLHKSGWDLHNTISFTPEIEHLIACVFVFKVIFMYVLVNPDQIDRSNMSISKPPA